MNYIRTENGILDTKNTNKFIYVIRDNSIKENECYVSYIEDWRKYFLIDYQNCIHFSYNSAQNFISDLIKENLKYQNLIIELSPYYKDCKQADTIEELCDELVYNHQILSKEDKNNKEYLSQLYCFNDIYGAIWTDKGLIYVAKLNSEGVLELI